MASPTRVAAPTVTAVVPVRARYVARSDACPGACAARRPQLPARLETLRTPGALLAQATSEVRSACVPSLKNPVAAAAPLVPGAYWSRSATATMRWSAALLTTTRVDDGEPLIREEHVAVERGLSRSERLHQPARPGVVAHRDDALASGGDGPVHQVRHQPSVRHGGTPGGGEAGDGLGRSTGGEDRRVRREGERGRVALSRATRALLRPVRHRAELPDRTVLVGVAGGAGEVELAAGEHQERERAGGAKGRSHHPSAPPRAFRDAAR